VPGPPRRPLQRPPLDTPHPQLPGRRDPFRRNARAAPAPPPPPPPPRAPVLPDAHSRHHVLDLTLRDARAAHHLAASCLEQYKAADDPRFLDEAPVLAHDLPLTVRRHLNSARRDKTTRTILIRHNVVDQKALGPTPGHWSEADTGASQVYGCLLVLYAALLGDLTGRANRQAGRLIGDLLPGQDCAHAPSPAAAATGPAWHTEDAAAPHRPDWVGLFALRDESRVPLSVAHVDAHRLPDSIRTVLSQPRFVARPDPAHQHEQTHTARPVPVLSGAPGPPVPRLDRAAFRAQDGDGTAAEALAHLIAHLDARRSDVPVPTGTVCFVDNRTAVHGRRPCPDGPGADRWLKHVTLVRDLRRTRPGRLDGATRLIG